MDEPRRISDARVGQGARRVQPNRARLQPPARPQYRGAAKADRHASGLKATPSNPHLDRPRALSPITALDRSFTNQIASLRKLPHPFIAAEKQCSHTVWVIIANVHFPGACR